VRYLLDTCLISKLVRKKPSSQVTEWVTAQEERDLCLSVLTIGELVKGVHRLTDASRKRSLSTWISRDVMQRFGGRVLPVSVEMADCWGRLTAQRETAGAPLPVVDGLIAATAMIHHLAVVTRNISHMAAAGVQLLNPCEPAAR